MDAAQQQLAANYTRLQQLCAAAGAPPPDDASFRSFQASVGEWSSMLHHHSAAGKTVRLHRLELDMAATWPEWLRTVVLRPCSSSVHTSSVQASTCRDKTSMPHWHAWRHHTCRRLWPGPSSSSPLRGALACDTLTSCLGGVRLGDAATSTLACIRIEFITRQRACEMCLPGSRPCVVCGAESSQG